MLAMTRTMPDKYRNAGAAAVPDDHHHQHDDDPDEHDDQTMEHTDNSDEESHDSFDDDENVIKSLSRSHTHGKFCLSVCVGVCVCAISSRVNELKETSWYPQNSDQEHGQMSRPESAHFADGKKPHALRSIPTYNIILFHIIIHTLLSSLYILLYIIYVFYILKLI